MLRDELYVMLMLQRSEEGGAGVDCEDPVVALACLDPELDAYKDCPAACRDNTDDEKDPDEKVKSGDLAVTAEANNGKAILADGVSDMDTLTFKTSEEVEITRVVLERYGYSTSEDVAAVWLEDENGTVISTDEATIDSKWQVKLSLKKDYRNVDGVLNATVVIKTTKVAGEGNKTIWFKVIDVTSTAKNVDLDNYKPYTYTVVNYAGSDVILTTRAATKNYNWEAKETYEVAKFKLKAPSDSAIVVKSFTLTDKKGNEIDFDEFIEDVIVTVAGEEVKSSYKADGKENELTINLNDVELAAKDNAEFVVSLKLSKDFDRLGKTVNFYIAETSDVSATDTKTSSRVLIKALATYASAGVTPPAWANADDHMPYEAKSAEWYVCNFDGWKVKITSTKLGNVDASEDSTDILIAEWEISTVQSIKTTKDASISIKVDGDQIVRAMRLVIAGDEYEGKPSTVAGKKVFTFPSIEIDHTSKIKVLVDTNETAPKNNSTTFTIEGFDNFQYVDAKDKGTKVDIAGALNISKLTIADSEADLTNTLSSDEVEFKANESSEEVEILKGTYKADQRDVYLKEFSLSTAAANWPKDGTTNNPVHKMTVYLYIGGNPVADAKLQLSGTSWVASDSFSNVKVKAGESTDVVVTAVVEAKALTNPNPVDSIQFTLKLNGEDENGNENSGVAEKKTAKISIVEKGTADVTAGTASKTVLLRWSSDGIATFTVKPSGASSLDLESVSFDKPEGVDCDKLRLEGANKNFKLDGSKCVADGFVKQVSKEGLALSIEFKDTPDAATSATNGLVKVDVKNLQVNGKDANETFATAYADGIVKFTQSGEGKASTTYKVAKVEGFNANTKVRDIRFYDANGAELKTDLWNDEVLTEWKEFTIQNRCDKEILIEKMSYKVVRSSYSETVTVEQGSYPDYFKTTGWDRLKVYVNSKDTCTADTTVTVKTTLAEWTIAAGDLTSWGYPTYETTTFHAGALTITAGDIAWSLNVTTPAMPWTTWPLANSTKFVVLKVADTNADKVEVTYTNRHCGDDSAGRNVCVPWDADQYVTVPAGETFVVGIAGAADQLVVKSSREGATTVTDTYELPF